ncbi:MAG: hypothetical protein QM831_07785 [Kofleriaceae bacterium]
MAKTKSGGASPKTSEAVTEPTSAANKSSSKGLSAIAYWTPEQMRSAQLHPALKAKRSSKKEKKKPAKADAQAPKPKRAKPRDAERRIAALSTEYQTTVVTDASIFPSATIGKIYYTMNGGNYFCTGYVVGNRVVFTLASVLYDRGSQSWAQNVVFYPQYNNGPGAGLGAFEIGELWCAAGWQEDGNYLHNWGALIGTGAISPFTGSVGLMANYPANQGQYLVYGYPGTPTPGYPFDGERMWQTVSAYIADYDWSIYASGNMTYGAHGAPWLIFREGGWHANGIYMGQVVDPDGMLSPYFGNELWDFYTFLQGKGYT